MIVMQDYFVKILKMTTVQVFQTEITSLQNNYFPNNTTLGIQILDIKYF